MLYFSNSTSSTDYSSIGGIFNEASGCASSGITSPTRVLVTHM